MVLPRGGGALRTALAQGQQVLTLPFSGAEEMVTFVRFLYLFEGRYDLPSELL